MSRQAFEIAQHLETGYPQPAGAHHVDSRVDALGVSRDIARRQHDLREAGVPNRRELGRQRSGKRDRVHAEVADVGQRRVDGRTVVNVIKFPMLHQLEHDAAEETLGQCAARLGMHALRLDERDAALLERGDRRQHIGRAESDSLEHFSGLSLEDSRHGFDQLEKKLPQGLSRMRPLGRMP